ncbi:hypothetical protein APA_3730 [Pseudanabaena sp. lw0831]|nr:hypothetical protein APA_3730 [Pseudanabaena sp. lw0831]
MKSIEICKIFCDRRSQPNSISDFYRDRNFIYKALLIF